MTLTPATADKTYDSQKRGIDFFFAYTSVQSTRLFTDPTSDKL